MGRKTPIFRFLASMAIDITLDLLKDHPKIVYIFPKIAQVVDFPWDFPLGFPNALSNWHDPPVFGCFCVS
jgi:hypothetical protein